MAESKAVPFATLLQRARQLAGKSRADLADVAGLSPSYVFRLENRSRDPSREAVLRLAESLELGAAEINAWLLSAGYESLPLLAPPPGSAGPTPRSVEPDADDALGWSPHWSEWLELAGMQRRGIERFLQALDASPASRPRRSELARAVGRTLAGVTDLLGSPVQECVIPAAGSGHRILAPQFVQRLLIAAIREAIECGIGHVVLVLPPGAVEVIFQPLSAALTLAFAPPLKLEYVVQDQPRGLGEAVLLARSALSPGPFAVVLPDDVIRDRRGATEHVLRRLVQVHQQLTELGFSSTATHVLAVDEAPRSKLERAGVAEVSAEVRAVGRYLCHQVLQMVEKPTDQHPIFAAGSRARAIVGRYVLGPSVVHALSELRKKQPERELDLTLGIERCRRNGEAVYALPLDAHRHDTGVVIRELDQISDGLAGP